ncbi:MAG: LysR family transcriptional regulator, partial [Rhizobiaceae bacterium]|nr:LysR family transcriptional regulator [Rhizobiaceae bacterium]
AAMMHLHAVILLNGAAKMQAIDWNDLRHILAVARGGSFAAAGRSLSADATTISRRLRIVEERLGAQLFHRAGDGAMTPTTAGEIAIAHAEAVEAEMGALTATLAGTDLSAAGKVRITAPPFVINRLLIPAAGEVLSQHSGLELELIGDSRNLNLIRREADMALRLARPAEMDNTRVVARRLTVLDYAIYVAADNLANAEELPWLVYDETMAHLPHARWIAATAEKARASAIAVNEAEALVQAALAGLGRALLPRILGDRVNGLARIDRGEDILPTRELWLLMHADLRHIARIRAVADWLEQLFRRREPREIPDGDAPIGFR